jgi:hypothetical protein
MFVKLFATVCIILCLVVIFYAWKIYRDTRKIADREDEEDELQF